MSHCFLIGGSGFIGRPLSDLLLRGGRRVTAIGRSEYPRFPLTCGVEYISGDYGDVHLLAKIVEEADEIILLAYTTVPKTSFDDPIEDITTNLPSAVRLFDAASRSRLKKLVFVSSGGTVYGIAGSTPITENHPTAPISPYGITKLAIEQYAMMYMHTAQLPVVCVRPSNAYGEGQLPFSGQGFIATAIASIFEGREIVLYGQEGTIRDYIHVSDVVAGIGAALEGGKVGSCYNIGSGIGRTNLDILNSLRPLAHNKKLAMQVRVLPKRPFDVPVNILDSTRLHQDTGWKPTIKFNAGLKGVWDWYSGDLNGKEITSLHRGTCDKDNAP